MREEERERESKRAREAESGAGRGAERDAHVLNPTKHDALNTRPLTSESQTLSPKP